MVDDSLNIAEEKLAPIHLEESKACSHSHELTLCHLDLLTAALHDVCRPLAAHAHRTPVDSLQQHTMTSLKCYGRACLRKQ